MRLYLDLCCFNRPFDDQSQTRVRVETDAKLELQAHVSTGKVELIWSYVLDYENAQNPFAERRESIARWRSVAVDRVPESESLARSHDIWRPLESSFMTRCMQPARRRARRRSLSRPTMPC